MIKDKLAELIEYYVKKADDILDKMYEASQNDDDFKFMQASHTCHAILNDLLNDLADMHESA